MVDHKALTCAVFCTFAAMPAQAQDIPHHPVATVCFQNGECATLPGGVVFPSEADCNAALPQLYVMLVNYLMEQGVAAYVLAADVVCEPNGSDA